VNGTVKVVGKVPSIAELKTLLSQAAEMEKAAK